MNEQILIEYNQTHTINDTIIYGIDNNNILTERFIINNMHLINREYIKVFAMYAKMRGTEYEHLSLLIEDIYEHPYYRNN